MLEGGPSEYTRENYEKLEKREKEELPANIKESEKKIENEKNNITKVEQSIGKTKKEEWEQVGLAQEDANELDRQYNELAAHKEENPIAFIRFKQKHSMQTEVLSHEEFERIRESEIKRNVDFWHSRGVEVDDTDVRHEIEILPEVQGFDWFIYMPGKNTIESISEGSDVIDPTMESDKYYGSFRYEGDVRNENKSYAIVCQYSRENSIRNWGSVLNLNLTKNDVENGIKEYGGDHLQDGEGYHRNLYLHEFQEVIGKKWYEKNKNLCMTTEERLVAELQWREQNKSSALDEKSATICYMNKKKNKEDDGFLVVMRRSYKGTVGLDDTLGLQHYIDGWENGGIKPRRDNEFFRPVVARDCPPDVVNEFGKQDKK